MSLLARLHAAQIANGEIIDADDLGEEYDQLVNILNGTSNNKEALIKLTSPTVAPLTLNQLNAAGPVQIWQLNTVDKLKVNALAQLESLLATGTAPFVVASTTKVANLNVDFLDGFSSENFATAASKVYFALCFKIDDPSTFPTNDFSASQIVRVPNIAGGFITRMHILFTAGSHTPGAGNVVTFSIIRNGAAATGFAVSLNDANNTINTFYAADPADIAIANGDSITVEITTRTGTISERAVSIILEGYQTLTL